MDRATATRPLSFAAAFDDALIALAQEGVRSGCRGGGFAEDALEVGVALTGGPATVFGAGCAG